MAKTHEQRDFFEQQWFEEHSKQLDNVVEKLDKNTTISQQALDQAIKTNSRVTHLEEDVTKNLAEARKISNRALTRANRTSTRLVDLEKVIIPDKPVESTAILQEKIETGDIRISKEAWWLIVKIVGFIGSGLIIIMGLIND